MKTLKLFRKSILILSFCLFHLEMTQAQYENLTTAQAKIDFSNQLREWDGFGVNYVQTAHTRNYEEFPQDYGGFSILKQEQKEEIIDLIFGEEGLKPGIVKMFLDPLHQKNAGEAYDHQTTTRNMIEFFDMGQKKSREWGGELSIITTLYGPPGYMTKQKTLRGRDMDPNHKQDLALYMIDWVKYLGEKGYPVKYISLHNEGEDWKTWPAEGNYANFDNGQVYNVYWRPEEVVDFLEFMPSLMKEQGIRDIGLTPGECSNWFQFYYNSYAQDILDHPDALDNLSLITSHNYYSLLPGGHRWFAGTSNLGTDMIREKKPDMHAWVTSASWGDMDAEFAWQIWMNIYLAKVNAYIPWAVIQRPEQWIDNDPNPSTAFKVSEVGTYKVMDGYYLYKQFSRAGQPGMGIAYTECRDSEVQLLGFSKNNTSNPDAFIVINVNNWVAENSDAVDIIINGNTYTFSNQDPLLHLYREGAQKEKYQSIREKSVKTDKGYLLEVAFSLDKLMLVPKDGIPLNIEIRVKDGDYSIAGELQWAEGGPFMLATGYNSYEYSIPYNPPTEESESDNGLDWSKVKEYLVREKSYPNTKKDFSAKWKVCYDMDNLYFLVDITDDTNLQGRRVNISLNGTGYKTFKAVRTIDKTETYHDIGIFTVENGSIVYDAPSRSVTTFTGIE